ncbi:UNC-like C-terminal-domain-containing protein [Glomus cerebriforme]|uniref:SUN-like protein 1 n=1 Tax=Glomus cerebriforme TaxID=658196 RepID=A0A397SIB1_9GLOM|nr:UNC-like C-terminal-domain-containing protein [Glomus cerebriforme]
MYWNGFLSTLNFIVVSFGPFFAPTHTLEPISIVNHIGESPAVPSLNKLIWTSSHCQDFLVGEFKSFNEPTISSAVNTAVVNDRRIHNHNKRQQNLNNKNRLKKNNQNPSRTTKNLVPTSISNEKFNSENKNNNENREPSDQKKRSKKKRVKSNTPKDSQTIESLDEEGDIGAVFENTDSSHGLISEYDTSDLSKLKERFNYASIDCGANVLKANKEAKGTSSVLSESKDSYVLNDCSVENYIIVELCYPILVDTIVLANFEFFSSTFKNIRVSISKWYPPKEDWKIIGEYRAKNSRELQIFNAKAPIMFAKYIRIDFQTHYGRHHYCPVSLLRVHGNSETDMWNKEQEQASSTSQVKNQINDEPNDDIMQHLTSYTESNDEDLNNLSNEVRKNPEYLGNLEDELKSDHLYQNNGITKLNDPNIGVRAYLVKAKKIFEYEVCPKNDLLNVTIFQDNSLLINPGICRIDQCPIIVTESDLLTDNYKEFNVSYDKRKREVKEKTLPVRYKPNKNDYNGKINLPIGEPNQSTFMFLYKGILSLESNTKRYVEEQSKLLKEIFGKVDSHSKKMDSIMDHFTNTVGNLKKQYEQLIQATFSEFHTNQSKLEEDLKNVTSNVHLLAAEVVFLKRLLLFVFLSFVIFIGVTHDWVKVRISLQDFHAAMNARALGLKFKSISINKNQKNADDFFDDDVNDIYSE